MFPKNAKVASATPVDKKTDEKNFVLLNFRPIFARVLNCFSKVCENILKKQLAEKISNLFSLLSLRKENRTTLSMYLLLIEERRKNLDNNYLIGAVLMDLSKALDCIPRDPVIAKLAAYGFDKNMLCYIYSYQKSRKQFVRVSSIKSSFEEIVSRVEKLQFLFYLTSFSMFFYILY